MLIPRLVAEMCSVGLTVLCAGVVCAQVTSTGSGQSYPAKPIRMLAPEPGGGNEVAGRIVAQGLSGRLGQQVIVDNRSGVIAMETVAKAPPDGYSLLFYGSTLWLSPFLRSNAPFDPMRDFSHITLAVFSPQILVVHPSLPAKSVKELIALAQARPGELNYASGNSASVNQLAGELFKSMAGVNIVGIPYKGGGPALNALLAEQVQLMFPAAATVTAHLKTGRLRALAVTSTKPSALAPGLPTVAASGLPGFEVGSMVGLFGPAKMHKALVNRLSQEVIEVLKQPEVKDKFSSLGVEGVGTTPDEFTAILKTDMARWGKVIKDAGIREE